MGIGVPGNPKINFWVSVKYRSRYRSGKYLGPGNYNNRLRTIQKHISIIFNKANFI